jgi:branched-chain amino acid transport system substrate-binding protein
VNGVTRREFLKLAGTAAGFAGLESLLAGCQVAGQVGGPGPQPPQEIPMLGIWPFTGAFADVGPVLDRGMSLALEEWGYKVIGRPIKYVKRDSETKADAATRRVEEAVETESVKYVIGPWSSGVALAVSEVAKRRKVLHFFSGGTEDISGKRCHRYSFQWAAHAYTAADTVMKTFLRENPGAKRWYLLIADYAFGWSLEKYLKLVGEKYGVTVLGADRHPLGEREFSGYVSKAVSARPDVVAMVNFGQDAIQAVRTFYNFGWQPKQPLIMAWSAGVEELVQLEPEMRENVWVGTNFYYTLDTPVAREFVKRYREKYGEPPGYAPAAAYGMTRLVLRGIEKAKSAEVPDVIQALEGWEGEDLLGKMRIDPKTHQTLRPYFFLKCKKKSDMKDQWDFADIIGTGDTPQPAELNECADIGSL